MTDQPLRKSMNVHDLVNRLHEMEDVEFWSRLTPYASISDFPLETASPALFTSDELEAFTAQQKEEAYFQTRPVLAEAKIQEMLRCIENVRAAGFPSMFALMYDAFYQGIASFDVVLSKVLGPGYKMIPNFWVYYIQTSESGKGFEPHRDAEYPNTIGPDGLPTVLTLWIALTEATPLNSCMYLVPANRDPEYMDSIQDIAIKGTQFALEDIRALPAQPGTLSAWDQYLFHWGSRSSRRAPHPRISYALYCQRGDMAPVDDAIIDLSGPIPFETRLGLICRGIYRYSYMSLRASEQASPLLEFMEKYTELLKIA